ncbi:unnamed protein product [Clonostachys rosea f. rosea IK726]|jgi:bacteriorhodopsin|uniref:Opsin-like protein carO n=2 Tax=Bionectria ochroleuca TaxID=29856 RepID=A0A0B7JS10_BIOOC|nr:unnamed protein product [Clonostachys rosea f. rosea IK726]
MLFDDLMSEGGHKHPVDPIPTVIPDPVTYERAGGDGFRTLWVIFVIFIASAALFSLQAWRIPVSRRIYHVLTTVITIVGALSYFAMASGSASALNCHTVTEHHHKVPNTHHDVCRQVFWSRYVDWAITTPLLLIELGLLAGLDGAHIAMAVFADLVMVFSGLFSALGEKHTAQTWGWFTIAVIAYIFVIWHIAVEGALVAKARGERLAKLFGSLAGFILILWAVYPIIWGIAQGGHRMSVDAEIITYAVLDMLTKVVFGFWILISNRQIPETIAEVGGWWSHGLNTNPEGRIRIGNGGEA